ncbi:Protein of unknown function DUF4817 [Trinorchestia longiramus]|nr:Protein of unknown function DUF4817 [Trinorchestia longiramus]
MQLTKEQRTFIVDKYFQSKSFRQVIQSFQEHFPERQSPTKMTIWRNLISACPYKHLPHLAPLQASASSSASTSLCLKSQHRST